MISNGTRVLILASESPRRKELLEKIGAEFMCVPARIDECSESDVPELLPENNAVLKAAFVADRFPDHFVLGADTGVFFGKRMFGKPADDADAENMLAMLSGNTHQVITGTALICRSKNVTHSWSTVSDVTFGPLSETEIKNYMHHVHVLDKAGAYGIQEHPELLKASWNGELENIIGLPLVRLRELLKQYKLLH